MKNETIQYLKELQEKINQKTETFIESSQEFNRGYLTGQKIMLNDVLSAVLKMEGEN